MEAIAGIVGIAEGAARAGSKLWQLTASWRDAPRDVHQLRDDLDRTSGFYNEIRQGIENTYGQLGEMQPQLKRELHWLVDDGYRHILELERIIDRIQAASGTDRNRGIGPKGRLTWLLQSQKVARLRLASRDVMFRLFGLLVTLNMSVFSYTSTRLSS
jgi:hypothetical protein